MEGLHLLLRLTELWLGAAQSGDAVGATTVDGAAVGDAAERY